MNFLPTVLLLLSPLPSWGEGVSKQPRRCLTVSLGQPTTMCCTKLRRRRKAWFKYWVYKKVKQNEPFVLLKYNFLVYVYVHLYFHTQVPLIHGSDNHFSMKTRIFIWAINNLLFLNITRMLQFFLKLLNSSYTASSHAYHCTTQKMRIKTVTFLCLSILWNTTVLT